MQELLDVRHAELNLDGQRPDAAQLGARLAGFWCADEVVLYGGRAGPRGRVSVSELSDRVAEYYATPLGARSPHAGAWPLKTLAILSSLYVHYGYCADDRGAQNADARPLRGAVVRDHPLGAVRRDGSRALRQSRGRAGPA